MTKPSIVKFHLEDVQALLREMSACMKTLSLYPENHPAIGPAVERTLARLGALLQNGETLEFGFTKKEALIIGEESQEHRIPTEVAERFHQLGVLTIRFSPGLDDQEFHLFMQYLASQRKTSTNEIPINEMLQESSIKNIGVTLVDYRKIVEQPSFEAQGEESENVWAALIKKAHQGNHDAVQEMAACIASPSGFESMNAGIFNSLRVGPEDNLSMPAAKVVAEIHQKVFQELSHPEQQEFSENLTKMLFLQDRSSTKSRDDLLETFRHYPDEMLLDVLAGALVRHGSLDTRRVATFQKLFHGGDRKNRLAQMADAYMRNPETTDYPALIWDQIDRLFLSGSEDAFMSKEYHRVLEDLNLFHLSELQSTLDSDSLSQVRAALEPGVPAGIRKDIILELVHYHYWDCPQEENITELRSILKDYARNCQIPAILTTLEQLYAPQGQTLSASRRRDIEKGIFFGGSDSWLSALIRQIARMSEEDLKLSKEILKFGGKNLTKIILQHLGEERRISGRKRIVSLLIDIGPMAVPQIMESLGDERWFLVRNLVMILGKIGDDSCIDQLTSLLSHEHHRVRQEALVTLSLIGGDNSVPLIRRVLLNRSNQADPNLQTTAALALKRMDTAHSRKVLQEALKDRDKNVQVLCDQVLKGAL